MRRVVGLIVLCGTAGCAGDGRLTSRPPAEPPAAPSRAEFDVSGTAPQDLKLATRFRSTPIHSGWGSHHLERQDSTRPSVGKPVESATSPVQTVAHRPQAPQLSLQEGTLTIDGKQYRVQLVEEPSADQDVVVAGGDLNGNSEPGNIPAPRTIAPTASPISTAPEPTALSMVEVIDMNLPTALSMVGGQHPAVGVAQWRVQEAYAQLEQAEVLWLPSIQAGFSFHRHDGNYQASDGRIVDVNRNSFQYGLGAGATGAGTTPRPGLVAQFHLADAIFQPEIARTTAWARGHAANGVMNEQLLNVAVAYLELLDAWQDARILEETRDRTRDLSKLTSDFAATGQGLQADADRLETELILVDSRLVSARERIDVASARLSQQLSIAADRPIAPLDPTVVPLDLVALDMERGSLISTGLMNRPELKESQALVAAACEQYQRQKYAPFVPSVLLGFSTGGFGGGLGNNLDNVDERYDFDALMTWEVRNLGFGERAARRAAASRIQQAKYEKVRVMDQVVREVSEAHAQVLHRAERIEVTRAAIESARNSYERNLSRIRDGQGLPLEVLQSVQALETARRAYLSAVMDYNEAQFRLQWALGWPVVAPPEAVNVDPTPAPPSANE
ncbi:Outer membrane efflux protein [Maioricimonas rarisocia]|uniref:Outer membrane efflux protein n=1 Tax=Maioricimonas rarisocia TaxID=2528026 RepID=A0A517Z2Y3_9PLAN|nr:TolC family protein [Maioricimonas rarisocia]QDU36808.1 Outer membrane efflux protein [Maioricimonas rarisocia]